MELGKRLLLSESSCCFIFDEFALSVGSVDNIEKQVTSSSVIRKAAGNLAGFGRYHKHIEFQTFWRDK